MTTTNALSISNLLQSGDPLSVALNEAKATRALCEAQEGPCGCGGPNHASDGVEGPCGASEGALTAIPAPGESEVVDPDVILPIDPEMLKPVQGRNVAKVRRGRDAFLLRLQKFPNISLPAGQFWRGNGAHGEGGYLTLHCSAHGEYQVRPTNVGMGKKGSGCAGCQHEAQSARLLLAAQSLTGEKFGILTVESTEVGQYNHASKKGGIQATTFAFCRCECGREIRVMAHNLKSGRTQSCGQCQPRRSELVQALDPKTAYEPHHIYLGPVDLLADWHKLGITNNLKRRESQLGIPLLWQMRLQYGEAWVTEQVLLEGFYRHGFRRFSDYHLDPDEVTEDLVLQKEAMDGDHLSGLPRLVNNGLSEVIAGLPSAAICNALRRVLKEVKYWGPERVLVALWPGKKKEVEKILGRAVEAAPTTGFFLPERYLNDDDDDDN